MSDPAEEVLYEVIYKCTFCHLTFPDITEHLKQCQVNNPQANKPEESEDDDQAIAFVIKNVAGLYECSICSKTYKSLRRFIDHTKIHDEIPKSTVEKLEEILKDLKSDKKDFSFEMIETDDGTRYRCAVCNTIFETRKSLVLHFPIHRNVAAAIEKGNEFEATDEVHHCKLCNRSLKNEYEMELHMKAHEENNTTGQSSVITDAKQPKRKKTEGGKATFPCQYCGKEFKRPHEKVKHERVHTGEKPYSCDICGKQFRVTYCLSLHKRNVHSDERPYICTYEGCNKRFKSQSVYNHHLNTHGTEKNFKCPFCPKAFKTSVQLAGHKNTHTKPFSCQVCSRAFASLYAVRIHREVHNSEETSLKYTCKICMAQYGRKFALKDHMKLDHPEENAEVDDDDENEEFVIEELDEADETEVYSLVEVGT